MKKKPLVSICCTAYNHENYLRNAIEGFLMQKTSFPFEVVIHDDASTDNTSSIIKEYAEKYPDVIVPILQTENQYSKGIRPSPNFVWPKTKGKYIALCEGDDYWTDPLKLQKQVGFLEANPDFSLCFHDALVIWEGKSRPPKYFCPVFNKDVFDTNDVINSYFIHTASMVFRSENVLPHLSWFKKIYNGDLALQLILSTKGKIKFINSFMSVYRKNPGALSGGVGKDIEYINAQKINLLGYFNDFTVNVFENQIEKRIRILEKQVSLYNLKKRKLLYAFLYPNRILKSVIIRIANQIEKSRN